MMRRAAGLLSLLVACKSEPVATPPTPLIDAAIGPPAPVVSAAASPPTVATVATVATGCPAEPETFHTAIVDWKDLPAHVCQIVTLEAWMENKKEPTILGADVSEDSGVDPRGKLCRATGLLTKTVVTKEELAAKPLAQNRGAGTFYRVVDPKTGSPVVAVPFKR